MPERSGAYGPDLPPIEFCIDSPAIEPGERDMFLFGFEYAMQLAFLMRRSTTAWPREVHAANEFRLRKLFTLFRRAYKFTPIEGKPEKLTLEVGPLPEMPEAAAAKPMVFVVTSGAGSVLGVFTSREAAEESFQAYDPVIDSVPLEHEGRDN